MDPTPFLRGNPFPGIPGIPYPRAKPDDFARLPADTWMMAQIPAGVRLELEGDAEAIEIDYETRTDQLFYRGAGTTFEAWRDGVLVGAADAALGTGTARVPLGPAGGRVLVYVPAGMRPEVRDVRPVGGAIEPAAAQPRWTCYGDSIAEGWIASSPALAWPAVAAREHGLDVANLGYAGAARGEVVSAEHAASLPADVITITHGTNCWTRTPHSVGLFREGVVAFLDVVRQAHPETPIVVASPVVRPDAEAAPNRFGTTLAHLRAAMETVVEEGMAAGDANLHLVRGRELIEEKHLGDGIHPDDEGHRLIAEAIGATIAKLLH